MTIAKHALGDYWRRTVRRVYGDDYGRANGSCRLAPEWLVLVVNNTCNLRCKMCDVGIGESASAFYTHLVGDDPRNMSLDLLEVILDQAARFLPKPKIGLAYTEPLIHPRLLDFCRAITGRGFYCTITTNGWMLPRLAEALVEIGVDEITVSIDGPEEIHDRIRGRRGSFRKLYEGVERLNRAKARAGRDRPAVRFSYTLTDENYTHLLTFVRQVEPLQPAAFVFSHLNFITEEMAAAHNAQIDGAWAMTRSNIGTMNLDAIDLEALWRALAAVKTHASTQPAFPPLAIVPDLASVADLEIYYRQPLRFVGGRHCTDPWRMMMIRTDGTVIPAHGRCYDIPAGSVTETPLPKLWDNARFRAFRRTLQDAGGTLPACARCCGVIGKPKVEA